VTTPWPLQALGDPARPVLVFLHGFLGSGEDWLNVARQLSREFFCLLPDLPGHGENPLGARHGYQSWAVGLRNTLREQDIPRAGLVGYSLGGRLALYFALQFPEMVASLALESANPGIGDPHERVRRAAWDDENAERMSRVGMDAFLAYWYGLPIFASLARIPTLKAELRRQRARQSPEAMAAVVRALSPGRQPDLWPRLPELKTPVLVYSGVLDEKYTAVIQRMAALIPGCRAAILPEAGHNVHREQPGRVVRLLRDWLLKLPSSH